MVSFGLFVEEDADAGVGATTAGLEGCFGRRESIIITLGAWFVFMVLWKVLGM
mgnify:CR=1 FL=1